MTNSSIFWDQILFCVVSTVFLVINLTNLRPSRSKVGDQEPANEQKRKERKYWKHLKVLLSFYATFLSPILFIGFSTETYLIGSQLLINLASVTIGYLMAFTFLLPIVFGLDKSIKTPYEYFEKRFDSRLPRVLSALSACCFYFSLASLFLYGASIVLVSFLPMEIWLAALIIGIYSACSVLAKQNHFKFTFWTSLCQFAVFLAGIIIAIVITIFFDPTYSASEKMQLLEVNNRLKIIISDSSPTVRYTVWNQLFSLPIPWAVVHCLTAANFTKYRSLKTSNHSRIILGLNIPFMLCVNSSFWFSGICAFLYFYGCDPVHSNQLQNKNQISTKWFIDSISSYIPSLAGISLACLFVFSLYQQSITLAACSKTLVNDVLANKYIEKHTDKIRKGLFVVLVGLSVAFSVLLSYAKNSILSLFFFFNNTFNSPILGIFLLSVLNPYANSFGASLSFFLSLAFELWRSANVFFFSNLKSPELKPSFLNCSESVSSFQVANTDYSPKNSALFYLFSISSIWFCLFSVVFILVFGSLFSVCYSLLRYNKFAHYSENRKDYLFSLTLIRFERNSKKELDKKTIE